MTRRSTAVAKLAIAFQTVAVASRGRDRRRKQQPAPKISTKRAKKRREHEERTAAVRQEKYESRLATRDDRLESIGAQLVAFFGPLGVDVSIVVHRDRDAYVVDGREIAGGFGGWQNAPASSQDQEIDKYVAQYLARRFVDAVTMNAAPLWPGARAYYVKSDHGFVLAWPEAEVGFVVITPTHAQVFRGGPTLKANYLLPGDHWARVKRAIDEHEAEQRTHTTPVSARHRLTTLRQPVRVPQRILASIPDAAPRATVRFLIDASRRVRLERQVVFGAPVVLEGDFGNVRFDPIEGPADNLVVPFRLSLRGATVEGGIVLSSERDPLRIELYRDDVADDMFVWSAALSGFADLTTWDMLSAARDASPRQGVRRAPPSGGGARSGAGRVGPTTATSRRLLPKPAQSPAHHWPEYLKPLGDTAMHLASFVAGHRRLLATGWTPSAEAAERAALVGIKLGPNETWVRPHVRGAPVGYELRFAWKRRRALASS